MGKLLPILLFLVGTGAGIGAGIAFAPSDAPTSEQSDAAETEDHGEAEDDHGDAKEDKHAAAADDHGDDHGDGPVEPDYIKLNNQFVVPVVASDRVEALVILSLSIEAEASLRDTIFAREPKIRDAFLQVLFDHANMGGFQGAFTKARTLDVLRTALTEVARKEFGPDVHRVLIMNIARQDV